MPILLRGCIGIGHSAATHHSGNYYPMYRPLPGPARRRALDRPTTPRACSSGRCAATTRCCSWNIASSSASKGPVPEEDYEIEFGRAAVVREGTRRHGRRAGADGPRRLKARETLAREGISVELIDPRTVAPLDVETILPIGRQDRPTADRRRDVRTVRLRRRDRGPDRGRGLRRSRRADPPAQRRFHARRRTARPWKRPSCPTPEAIAQAVRDLMAE